ncbi:hypothetical protein HPB51_025680 [Rhipicephalus microplus]|uniref:Methionine aminopeptidase n=1 Tax=Rhipicephalus microplus TaxID=6941 RepID=A0A9J6EKB8_RHIMP|nr:hypothetical protein HPB51_025680 [Rhipicephalus microplus]
MFIFQLAREVLDVALGAAAVGVTTDELDRLVHEASIDRDCYPSPLNYYKFPKSCCTSVNEVICHGIPDMRPLQDGDLLNVDITVYHRGFHGDLNETVFIGNVDESGRKLVRVTYECLSKAIEAVKPGMRYREIGNIIQKHAQSHGFSVVRSYCGHGIHSAMASRRCHYDAAFKRKVIADAEATEDCAAGRKFDVPENNVRRWRKQKTALLACAATRKAFRGPRKGAFLEVEEVLTDSVKERRCHGLAVTAGIVQTKAREIARERGIPALKFKASRGWVQKLFHTAPSVPHYAKNKAIGVMKAGHCFTIEPMISEGTWHDEVWPDNWTAVTADGKRSAQFEQTLLVTDTGCEILTRRRTHDGQPWFMDK